MFTESQNYAENLTSSGGTVPTGGAPETINQQQDLSGAPWSGTFEEACTRSGHCTCE